MALLIGRGVIAPYTNAESSASSRFGVLKQQERSSLTSLRLARLPTHTIRSREASTRYPSASISS